MKSDWKSNKLKFLDEGYSSEKTRATYESYLTEVEPFEELYNKDFGEFNIREVAQTLNSLDSKSKLTINCKLSCYKSYHDWAIAVKLNDSGMNPIRSIERNTLKENTLNENEFLNGIITKEWLYSLKNKLEKDYRVKYINYQDIAALYLAYIGVCGKQANEIINLQWTDIDFDNKKIKVTNSFDKSLSRVINIDDLDIEILKEVKKEDVYYRHISPDTIKNFEETVELDDSDFVIKNIKLKSTNQVNEIKQTTIMNRLSSFKNELEYVGLEEFSKIKLLSLIQVKKSAQFEMLDNVFNKIEDEKEREKAIDTEMIVYADVRKRWGDIRLNDYNLQNTVIYTLRQDYIRYLKLTKES